MEFDDSLGNDDGLIDAGEEIILHVKGINKGHAMASEVMLSALCEDSEIHIENGSLPLGDVDINGTFATDITFTSDEDIIGGTAYTINFLLTTGAYEIPYNYIFSVGYALESFETGDLSFMDWDLGGEQPWFVTSEEAFEGEYSVRSGAIDDDEISSLILYANTSLDGDLSFHYKTSTANHDYLVLLIDDEVIKIWDKENDWKLYSTEIKAGCHVIEFRYDKSPNGVGGQDCVWIDNVIFPPTFIVTDVEETTTEKRTTSIQTRTAEISLSAFLKIIPTFWFIINSDNASNVLTMFRATRLFHFAKPLRVCISFRFKTEQTSKHSR